MLSSHLNMFLLPLLLFAITPSASLVFSSPGHEGEVWRVGEKKIVRYETKLTNYTIALWQSDLPGDTVDMGPILAWEQYGPKKEFPWVVQTYSFDLAASNVFFFLIFDGGPSNQGKIGYFDSFSSSDFNITDTPAPSSPSVPKPSTAQQSTTQNPTPQQPTPQQPISGQSTSIPSESTTTAQSSQSATRAQPAPTDEAGRGEETGGGNSTYRESSSSASPGSLPAGAQAGIGIGVGAFGLTCIACGVLWFKYIRKQQRAIAELQERAFSQSAAHAQHDASVYKRRSPWEGMGTYLNTKPIEIG